MSSPTPEPEASIEQTIPMNLLPADQHPVWNEAIISSTTSLEDPPQLEYDEHDIDLIAEQVEDDDDDDDNQNEGKYQFASISPSMDTLPKSTGTGKTNITSDGIIDDDFESELGPFPLPEIPSPEEIDVDLVKKIGEYNILEYAGDDKFGRKIITCSACQLPNDDQIKQTEYRNLDVFFDYLFDYVLKTFEQYVTSDYVIVYFHDGLNSLNRPSYTWLMRAYRHIDRKYKKNLKALYIVHPTKWIKFLWPVLRSMISSKFSNKVMYINHLDELNEYLYRENLNIPTIVKNADASAPVVSPIPLVALRPTRKFHVPLQFILDQERGETIPVVIRETVDFIRNAGLEEPWIFCRTAPIPLVKEIQFRYNEGESILFEQFADVHLAATVLKVFIRDLAEPLFTFRLYPELLGLSALRPHDQLEIIRDLIIERLPSANYHILKYLIEFLHLISTYSDVNQMTSGNLALIFGSNLIWSEDSTMNNLANYALINSLTEILISRYTELFFK